MTTFHDDVLGEVRLVDESDGEGSWEFAFSTPQGDVNGSVYGASDVPPEHLELLREVARNFPQLQKTALEALRAFIQDDPGWLDFAPGESALSWLALPEAEFAARFRAEWLKLSDDGYPVLVFATDLEGEHGLGVAFDGLSVVQIGSGGDFA